MKKEWFTKAGGVKEIVGKNRLDLLPFKALWELGNVYTAGAAKYADRNWEKGIPYMTLIGASLRHVFKWVTGENVDPETNTNHLANAAWHLLAIVEFELRGKVGLDDRPLKKGNGDEK